MKIDYDHSRNVHTVSGAERAFAALCRDKRPASLLDVGCGTGTWIKAALDQGIHDVFGVDGIEVSRDQLLFDRTQFRKVDLTKPWDLGRKFELALCLEVAEHLDAGCADGLIDALTRHSDTIIFSAASPGQLGQHHVNCQWPSYWQAKFNSRGFTCSDAFRWQIWDVEEIEPWYRQNMFLAQRAKEAGFEPRLRSVRHPGMDELFGTQLILDRIEAGRMSIGWYAATPFRGLSAKIRRRIGVRRS